MSNREAACSCGQLRLTAEGDPLRISVCHCLACQQRTGSPFGHHSRFLTENVKIEGRSTEYVRVSDDGEERRFHFCPECGSTVYYTIEGVPDAVGVPVGAFADQSFPAPEFSLYESRRHPWISVPTATQHLD